MNFLMVFTWLVIFGAYCHLHWLQQFLWEKLLNFPIYATHSLKSTELACLADSRSALKVPFFFPSFFLCLKDNICSLCESLFHSWQLGGLGPHVLLEWNQQILKMKKNIGNICFKIKQSRLKFILSNIRGLTEVFTLGD